MNIDICPNSFGDNHFCDLYGEYCTEIEDCDYKQLKKLEQLNKEASKIIDCKNGTITTLAQARDKYKEKLEKIEELINSTCFDYVGVDMVYFKNELLEIIRGEE